MCFLRCCEEADYQWQSDKLLEDFYFMHGNLKARFPLRGHNLLGLACFKPP